MSRLELSSKTRTDFSKSNTKKVRREGGIPATIYGHGEDSRAVEIVSNDLHAILKQPGGRLSLINLQVDGKADQAHPVMIKELQRDPVSRTILHVDFQRLIMTESVHASVPVVLIGEAPGVKLGGVLELITSNIEVKSLPDCIPSHFDLDISSLEIGQSIHLDDIKLPEGVEAVHAGTDAMVVNIKAPHGGPAAAEVAPAEAAPAAAPAE